MTPQQRVRQALAEHGQERIPAEIDFLFKILHIVLGRVLARNGKEWDEEKVADILIRKLRKAKV